jgi:hypothetical protein
MVPSAHGRVRRRSEVLLLSGIRPEAVNSASAPEIVSSIASLASPISCSRCFGSLTRQRRISLLIDGGVISGSADQSGSARITAASTSEIDAVLHPVPFPTEPK